MKFFSIKANYYTLLTLILLSLWMTATSGAVEPSPAMASCPIREVVPDLNAIRKWHDSNGDTADPFWADDDGLYTFMCDGRGFGKDNKNLNFNRLGNGDWAGLIGSPVNPMSDYGKNNQKGPDHATWKVTGQECIDGVFYAFVSRNVYGNENKGDPLMRQSSFNASLIKSTDRGFTWTRSADENYKSPHWPGTRFGAPGFFHYGKNGGMVTQDDANKYVYAISNNGFWNGGDDMILARIERAKLPHLQASDWTYYAGQPSAWVSSLDQAVPVLSRPAKLGWTSPTYVPTLQRYLLVSWYVTPTLKKWFEPNEVIYDFFEAPHPWGPWTQVPSSLSDRFITDGHMYGPNVTAKFQVVGPDCVRVKLFTSGCGFEDKPSGLYKMWCIPLLLKTQPQPTSRIINDNDPSIVYHGAWSSVPKPKPHYQDGDVHATQDKGDSLELTFEGTGIDVLSEKFHDLGEMEVFLDGTSRGTVNLALKNFPRLAGIAVFSIRDLALGKHTVRLVNRRSTWVVVDAFRIYGHP